MNEPLSHPRDIPGPTDRAAREAALVQDLMMVMDRFERLLVEHRKHRLSDAEQHALASAIGVLLKALLRP